MDQSFENTKSDPDSSVMAILKRPQNSTSVTKFAGPYISSIMLQNTEEGDREEESA